MSQALLQAARAGTKPKPVSRSSLSSTTHTGEDGPAGTTTAGGGDEDDILGKNETEKTFTTVRWQLVPRHLESPEVEYLSKRRHEVGQSKTKGTATSTMTTTTTTMKRATVKRTDTDGNSVIEEVLVAEGQTIDGEILAETTVEVISETGAVVNGGGGVDGGNENGGTAVDQPTPSRRRPPPPKRKAKGPGRGRKKKVQFTSGEERGQGQEQGREKEPMEGVVGGQAQQQQINVDDEVIVATGDVQKEDDGDRMDVDMVNVRKRGEDVEMGGEANMQDGENDDEEEGEDLEDDDREEGELSPTPEGESESTPVANPVATATNIGELPTSGNGNGSVSPTKPVVGAVPPDRPSADRERDRAPLPPPPPPPALVVPAPAPAPATGATIATATTTTGLDLNPTGLKHPLPPKPGPPPSFYPPRRLSGHAIPIPPPPNLPPSNISPPSISPAVISPTTISPTTISQAKSSNLSRSSSISHVPAGGQQPQIQTPAIDASQVGQPTSPIKKAAPSPPPPGAERVPLQVQEDDDDEKKSKPPPPPPPSDSASKGGKVPEPDEMEMEKAASN